MGFLVLQLVGVVRARFVPDRYFCWAPFHDEARYRVAVEVAGRRLSEEAVAARYQLPDHHLDGYGRRWELNTMVHVLDWIERFERTYGRSDGARVLVTWWPTEDDVRQWSWPPAIPKKRTTP